MHINLKDDFPKDIEAVAEFVRGDEEGATGIKLQGNYGLKIKGPITKQGETVHKTATERSK